jgi:hypothetical protein
MTAPPLHPDLQPLGFLVGTWRGSGRGDYPTIEGFAYEEEISFTHVGKPFLFYHQRTWEAEGRRPLHTEAGYLRPVGTDGAELVIAQPTGITEIHAGPLEGRTLRLRSLQVGLTPTAVDVRSTARTIAVAGDELQYELDMAAVGQPLQFHLEATLHRIVP